MFTTAVLMMAVASDVSMATGSGSCVSNRQVKETDGYEFVSSLYLFDFFGINRMMLNY